MKVQLVGYTEFLNPFLDPIEGLPPGAWTTDACGGQALAEFAGRACYQSWTKPNPKTATNAGYLAHILEIGHESVLEHASVTFYIQGVSRSLTHELVRHRHFSYSQLSQRYVDGSEAPMVVPPAIVDDPELLELFMDAATQARAEYMRLLDALEAKLAEVSADGVTSRRKQARQAARAVLPNATETKIVVTGNYRAWRHFINLRATEAADVEIRALAMACLAELQQVAPSVFNDYVIEQLLDGTEIAIPRAAVPAP